MNNFKLSNEVYDLLKYIALVGLPCITTFIGVVLSVVEFQYANEVITILVAFDTCLGGLLQISNNNYKGNQ